MAFVSADDTPMTPTFEQVPSDPIRLADGPGTNVSIDIDAPTAAVWALVTDVNLPARFSDEFVEGSWDSDARGLGATFTGTNENEHMGRWSLTNTIDAFEDGATFGWAVVSLDNPGARWQFDLDAVAPDRTRLTYTVRLGPGPSGLTMAIESMPDKEDRIILRRLQGLHTNMRNTVEGIRDLAEAS